MTLIKVQLNNIVFNFLLDNNNNELIYYESYDPNSLTLITSGYYIESDVILLEMNTTQSYRYQTHHPDIVGVYCSILKEYMNFREEIVDFLRPFIIETTTYMEEMLNVLNAEFWKPVSLCLSETDFKKLKTAPMSKKLKKELDVDEVDDCVICMEEIRVRQHSTSLQCKHIFHKNCIKKWLMNDCQIPTCPCCRADVRVSLK